MNADDWAKLYLGDRWVLFALSVVVAVMSITGSALLAAFFTKRSPAIRHGLLLATLCSIGLIPLVVLVSGGSSIAVIQLPLPSRDVFDDEIPGEHKNDRITDRSVLLSSSDRHGNVSTEITEAPAIAGDDQLISDLPGPSLISDRSESIGTRRIQRPIWFCLGTSLLLAAWAIGSMLLLMRFLVALAKTNTIQRGFRVLPADAWGDFRRMLQTRMHLPKLPQIGTSSTISSPVVTGLFRPLIIFPDRLLAQLNKTEIEEIAIHEIAHLIRNDLWVVYAQALVTIAYWPIPLIHLLTRELAMVREELCDIYVLKVRERQDYGQTLLRVARLTGRFDFPQFVATGVLSGFGHLERRVKRLLDEGRNESVRTDRLRTSIILTAMAILTAAFCSAKLQAIDGESNDSPKPSTVSRDSGSEIDEAKLVQRLELFGAKVERDESAPGHPVVRLSLEQSARFSDKYVHLLNGFPSLLELNLRGVPVSDAGLKPLVRLSNLKKLDVGKTKITDSGLKEIARLEKLESLSLVGSRISDTGLGIISKLKNLTTIDLTQTQITDGGLKLLTPFIGLTSLNLSETRITDAGLKSLSAFPKLALLILDRTKVTDHGMKELARLSGLQSLSLSVVPITNAGLAELRTLTKLTSLDLGGTKVSDEGLASLSMFENLTSLNLASCRPISDSGMKEIASLTKLTSLNLNKSQVTNVGVKELATLKQLRKLQLNSAPIRDAGLKELAILSTLTELWLIETEVTDDGLKFLGSLPNLTTLALNRNPISDVGLKEICKIKTLDTLYLSTTRISDNGLALLAELANLTTLHVYSDLITDSGMKNLVQSKNLRTLYLSRNQITDIGATELKNLPDLRFLNLSETKVADVTLKELSRLNHLESLNLRNTLVSDKGLGELTRLKSLKTLELGSTQITKVSLNTLREMKQLSKLGISKLKLTDAELKQLEEAMPNTQIDYERN